MVKGEKFKFNQSEGSMTVLYEENTIVELIEIRGDKEQINLDYKTYGCKVAIVKNKAGLIQRVKVSDLTKI